jgi:hypothetical protein
MKTAYHFSRVFNYLSYPSFKLIGGHDYPWDLFCRMMRGDRTFVETRERLRPDILFKKLFFKGSRGNNLEVRG